MATKIFTILHLLLGTTRKSTVNEALISDVNWSDYGLGISFDCATRDMFGGVLDVVEIKFRCQNGGAVKAERTEICCRC
jgi:hypothetical protein